MDVILDSMDRTFTFLTVCLDFFRTDYSVFIIDLGPVRLTSQVRELRWVNLDQLLLNNIC